MTLPERNLIFKIGMVFAAFIVLSSVVLAWYIIPACPETQEAAVRRSPGLLQSVMGKVLKPEPYAPFVSAAAAVLYAFVTIIVIYYFFEKTQSPEILFIAFFVLSFSVEAVRLLTPLTRIVKSSGLYFLIASRVLLFGRFFGLFSLFTASIYASGPGVQKQRNIIAFITIAALMIAQGVPIDTLTWSTDFCMIQGFLSLFRMVETGVLLITIVSFLMASYSRGSRDFVYISIGAFLAFLGRNLLLTADTWPGPVAGIICLVSGTWFICTRLHKAYLWL
jgi:hypothetical protein